MASDSQDSSDFPHVRITDAVVTFYFQDYTDQNDHYVNMPERSFVIVVGPPFPHRYELENFGPRTEPCVPIIYEGATGFMFDDRRTRRV